jgi:hypothetical protein
MIGASEKFPQILPVLFNGKIYLSTNLPWYYLPMWMIITIPIITLLFFIIGNIFIFFDCLSKSNADTKLLKLFVLFCFWLPILLVIVTKPVLYNAWRHFLFLTGPLVILSCVGFYRLTFSKKKLIVLIAFLLLALNIVTTIISMLKLHPYEYIYFNSLVGGLPGANNKFETDYWGASFREATEWININKEKLSHNSQLFVYPCLPHLASPYLNSNIIIDEQRATVFYCNITASNLNTIVRGKKIHTISRQGVDINIISSVN